MSGIEIAGLAIGVLPLLVELVKSYSAILRRAHTFRHYGKAVKSLSTQLDTQNGLFMNEIRLLLLCVEDEAVVESMLADASDQHWTRDDDLGKRLHLVLGNNFIICRNIIEEIIEMVVDLRKDLEQFDVFWDHKPKVSTGHAAPAYNTCRAIEEIAHLIVSDSELMVISGSFYEISDTTLERSRRHHP
jgi:hypothetical protein